MSSSFIDRFGQGDPRMQQAFQQYSNNNGHGYSPQPQKYQQQQLPQSNFRNIASLTNDERMLLRGVRPSQLQQQGEHHYHSPPQQQQRYLQPQHSNMHHFGDGDPYNGTFDTTEVLTSSSKRPLAVHFTGTDHHQGSEADGFFGEIDRLRNSMVDLTRTNVYGTPHAESFARQEALKRRPSWDLQPESEGSMTSFPTLPHQRQPQQGVSGGLPPKGSGRIPRQLAPLGVEEASIPRRHSTSNTGEENVSGLLGDLTSPTRHRSLSPVSVHNRHVANLPGGMYAQPVPSCIQEIIHKNAPLSSPLKKETLSSISSPQTKRSSRKK